MKKILLLMLTIMLTIMLTSCVINEPEYKVFSYNSNCLTKINVPEFGNVTVTTENGDTVCSVNNKASFKLASACNTVITRSCSNKKPSVLYYPSRNELATFMLEDLYPNVGDYDFNDLVVGFRLEYNLNKSNKVTSINVVHKIKATGYGNNPSGLKIVFVNPADKYLSISEYQIIKKNEIGVKPFTNTFKLNEVEFETKEMIIYFNKPCPLELLDIDRIIFVAEPQFKDNLFVTSPGYMFKLNPNSKGVDKYGMPFVLIIPKEIDYPMEMINIESVYPKFKEWRESYGRINQDWYIK